MEFQLNEWKKYRKKSNEIGQYIDSHRNKKTRIINLKKEDLETYIDNITSILLECSSYLDKCGLTLPATLWKYNAKDPTTHPSSKLFLYKHCMSKEAIKNYGVGFMDN